ncbi:MAG: dihydroorotase [Bdellovibrionaceae bacterium]|nr:dihydroorotase [Bdellovibrionales bacterium]MCB9085784.1 dihydroorotase [Pseudobdellovibrionaceae bacterium]
MNSHNTQQFELLIQGGECLLRQSDGSWKLESVDLGISSGRIQVLGSLKPEQAKTVFQAKGLQILPGLIDTQVHFREPGLEHKEDLASGTRGALLGGITAVFEMPNTKPNTVSALDLADKMTRAKNRAWTHYAFYLGASTENIHKLAELEVLPGCCGVKIFMGSSTGSLLVAEDEQLRQVLSVGKRRVAVHCEDEFRLKERFSLVENSPGRVELHPEWRDVETALRATKRIVQLGRETGHPLHILHVTTAEEMEFLKDQKDICTVECTPQHLTLTAPECYERLGTLAQMNPPIRDERHRQGLWKAVTDGVVDVLGSDHAPHTRDEKRQEYPKSPSGMTGVQTIVPLMLNHVSQGRLSLGRLVELLAYNPSRIWGLEGRGEIKVGARADLTVIDINREEEITNGWIASKSGWSPFDGYKVKGWPIATLLNGQVAMRDKEIVGAPAGRPLDFQL